MSERKAVLNRTTRETDVAVDLLVDGSGVASIDTGIGFFDHMLHALAFHAGWDLALRCRGDLQVDDHHTVEDCGIVLGQALCAALGERTGLVRFACAHAVLDEALARAVLDLGMRVHCTADLGLRRERIGTLACEMLPHFFQSFFANARMTVHIDVLRGDNDHHRAEAAFKSLAFALRSAARVEGTRICSTKGVLA